MSKVFAIVRTQEVKDRMEGDSIEVVVDPCALDNYMHPDALMEIHKKAMEDKRS